MAKYISGKFKNLKVGIKDYSEGKVALNVVGIISAASYQSGSSGITSTGATFHDLNVSGVSTLTGIVTTGGKLYVGDDIHIADNLYITSAGGIQNTGGFTNLYGNTVIGGVNDHLGVIAPADFTNNFTSSGISTFSNNVGIGSLIVTGVSTFAGNINANGNIVGDNATNISGINSVTATTFYGDGSNLTGIDGVSDGDKGDVVVSAGGTIWNLDTTGVTAGSYNNANITVDAKGRLTAASSGSGGGDANYALTAGIATNVIGGIGSLTQLHVSGVSTFTNTSGAINANSTTTNPAINIQFAGTTKGSLTPLSGGLGIEVSGDDDIVLKSNTYGGTSGDIFLQSGSTKVIAAKGTGEVGIGTDNPGSKLDVHGDVNVTGVSTLSSLDVTGNVSVGGTLTYEDVTNIDSVGFVTARSGLNVLGSGTTTTTLNVTGVTTLGTYTHANRIYLGSGNSTYVESSSGINLQTNASKNIVLGVNASGGSAGSIKLQKSSGSDSLVVQGDGNVAIAHSLSIARSLDVSGISSVGAAITMYGATGIVSATKYYGDGSSLTNLPGGGISGITIEDEGSALATLATTLDFVGDGVVASGTGAEKTITIAGGGGTWNQDSEGNLVAGTGAGAAKDSDTCFNVMIGCCAGALLDSGDHNILLGCQAGAGLTSGFNNVMIGECAGYDTTIGENNIFLGHYAGRDNISGDGNFAAGENTFLMSGASQKNAQDNIAIGKHAASRADEGRRNITLGLCAGYWNSAGDNIIALGYGALCCNISGDDNIGLGCGAGYENETGSYNIFMGRDAGKCFSNGNYHVAIGHQAARNCAHSGNDGGVYIGRSAGKGADGNWNVLIGCSAGECATGGGGKVGLGACALRNDRGNYNIGLGFAAGSNLTGLLADRNIAIGCNVSLPSAEGENQLAIGQGTDYWIVGDSDYNVGIGTTIPNDAVGSGLTSKLSVGIVSAFTFYGDGSNLTGTGGETLISGITVKDEGSTVGTAGSIKNINFIGDSVTASASGSDTANITITGGAPGDAGYWVKTDAGIHTLSKVGIGTTNPLTNLDVHDEVSFASTVSIGTTIDIVPNNTAGTLSFNGSAGTLLSLSNDLTTGSIFSVADVSGFGAIDVYADRKIAMAYVSAGDSVGIGTTNPLEKLHVVGVVSATSFFGDGSGLTNLPSSGGSSYWVKTDAGIHTTSKVGIGTTNPLFNLDVGSYVTNNVSTASTIRIIGENNSTAIRIGPGGTSNDITLIRVDSKDGTTDGTGNTDLGHSLKYMGSGSGADNRLAFWVDNTSNTAYEAVSIYNDGKFVVDGDPSGGGHGFHGTPTDAFTVRGTSKFTDGVCVTGVVTATSFSGDGSNLTGVSTAGMARRWNYINASGDRNLFTCDAGGTYEGGSSSCYNIAAGYHAMNTLTNTTSNTGCNIAIGRYAACSSDGACFNISIGDRASEDITDGAYNIHMGYKSGSNNSATDYNIYIGYCSGMQGTGGGEAGNCNIAIGHQAAKYRCGGSSHRNIALGDQSGYSGKGTDNISLGYKALYGGTFCGSHNIGIGSETGYDIGDGEDNIFMGRQAGYYICHGSDNIMLGRCAGYQQICGNSNIFLGPSAGYNVRNGDLNTMLGYRAGVWNCNGSNNVYIGDNSGGSDTRTAYDQGNWNVSIGSSAGRCMCTASVNTLLGAFAGSTLSEGDHNILLGAESGDNITTGSCNVFIGYNIQAPFATSDKQFGIGCATSYWIQGDENWDTTIAGIATVYSATGIVSATKFCGDGSGLTNVSGASTDAWASDSRYNLYAGTDAGAASGSHTCCNVAIGYKAACSLGDGATNSDRACANIAIGAYVGMSMTDANNNVLLGKCAGRNIVSGCMNIALGAQALNGDSGDGSYNKNIGIGWDAGKCLTSGDNNIFMGYGAGMKVSSAWNNIALGSLSGSCNCTGRYNVTLGSYAGYGITMGYDNIMIGCAAGKCHDGCDNILIGKRAAGSSADLSEGELTTGNFNIALGNCALYDIDSGNDNIALGRCAGRDFTTGERNILIGAGSSLPINDGSNQLVIGINTVSTVYNWIVGNADFNVGIGTTNPNAAVGAGNTAKLSVGIVSAYQLFGDGSGLTNVPGWGPDAQNNLYAGTAAGQNSDSDTQQNIAIGSCAGYQNSSGDFNVFIGNSAGKEFLGGNNSDHVLIGCKAGEYRASGQRNVAIGGVALEGNTSDATCGTGNHNVALGYAAGRRTEAGSCNVYLGPWAGDWNKDGSNNVFIGNSVAGSSCNETNNSIFIGGSAGSCVKGDWNIAIGRDAMECVCNGMCNLAMGRSAGRGSSTYADNSGCFNISFGHNAGINLSSGSCNIFIGNQAGVSTVTGSDNVAIGRCAGHDLDSGGCNTIIGQDAGCSLTTGNQNIMMGNSAGGSNTIGSRNVILGNYAGQSHVSGDENTYISNYAGRCMCNGSTNIAIGKCAMLGSSTVSSNTGSNNIAIGQEAGLQLTSGSCNIFLGGYAGDAITQGSCNVAIGYNVALDSATSDLQLAIGRGTQHWIKGDSSFNACLADGKLSVSSSGIVTAVSGIITYYGDGSNLTGVGGCSGVGTFDAAAGVAHTINSYTIASETFETSEYTIFAGIGSGIQSQKILVMEDGTTAYSQEYGVMYNNDTQLVSASARIVSGDIRVEVIPETGVTGLTTYRFSRQTT